MKKKSNLKGGEIMPRLENWRYLSYSFGYQTLDSQECFLSGAVYDDELNRFTDGDRIRTSTVQTLDIENMVAQTRNTQYILGEPDADYVKWLHENGVGLPFDF